MKKPTHFNLLDTDDTPESDGVNEETESGANAKSYKIELYRVIPEKLEKSKGRTNGTTPWRPRGEMPRELYEYVDCLRRADKLFARSGNGALVRRSGTRLFGPKLQASVAGEAERAYERALELLEQMMGETPAIYAWLDRQVVFGWPHDSSPTPDPEGVPRVITSRSRYKRKAF